MTDCNGCGQCCSPVVLPYSRDGPEPGWPAAEFIAAMDDTPDVTALVPIDILGMLTDRNPRGCYLRTTE